MQGDIGIGIGKEASNRGEEGKLGTNCVSCYSWIVKAERALPMLVFELFCCLVTLYR